MIKEIKNNELYFDGCSTTDLAKQYGTPLYVMSETGIKEKIRELKETSLDKGTQRKTTENELPSLTQCTA